MTTPSCNNNTFKTYFLYRLRSRLKYLVITLALNFCSITLLTISELSSSNNYYGSNDHIQYGLIVCAAIAQFALTIIGGVKSFGYCLDKESTDTVFSLPITRGNMFWADFLSGYISYVAAFIPCAAASISAVGWLYLYNNRKYYIAAFGDLILALFFSYTFAFILSALITICCGRKSSTVKCIMISFMMILIAYPVTSYFIKLCQIRGINYDHIEDLKPAPPLGTFFLRAGGIFDNISSRDIRLKEAELIPYLIYIPIAAALIAIAYFVFKRRKPENTGNNIAVKGFYYVLSGASAFILICFVCYETYPLHMWWLTALISVLVGGLTLFIFTIANKPKKNERKKHIIRSASIVVGCIAALFIVDKTGAFGTRYYNISPNKTSSIDISIYAPVGFSDGTYTILENLHISDREDMKRFIASCNQTLRTHSDVLQDGYNFRITYNLTDGKEISRGYSGSTISFDLDTGEVKSKWEGLEELYNNVRSLPHYPEFSAASAADAIYKSSDTAARMYGKFGEIKISKNVDLSNTLARDIRENFDINADIVGSISVYSDSGTTYIPIQSGYTDTIAFIEALRTDDSEMTALSISYNYDPAIQLKIKLKYLEQSEVKELLSLLKSGSEADNHSGDEFDIVSTDGSSYYVPDENKQRVRDLMLTIIENNISDYLPKTSQQ